MQTFNCPSCGAAIGFTSSVAVSTVCPYCRSLLVRHDTDVEKIGTMAELPQDISPFQIGTSGRYKNVDFTLVGRMKLGWSDGVWNEWFLVSDDGKRGWLAEAQGFLALSYESDVKIDPIAQQPKLGSYVDVDGKKLQVSDVKQTTCIGCEGELPVVAPRGRKTISIDLLGHYNEFVGIEIEDTEKVRVFIGTYVEFNDLAFSNLRELPGWQIKAAAAKPATANKKGKPDGGW